MRRNVKSAVLAAGLVFVLSFVLSLSALGQQRKVNLASLKAGATALPTLVIKKYKFDEKNGVKINWTVFASPPAVERASALGTVPINPGVSTPALIRYRNEGKRLVAIYSSFRSNHYVVVRKDSNIKTFADLKGKKVGIYGWQVGSVAALQTVARKRYGINMRKDLKVVVSSPPALNALLLRGEVVAISQVDPLVTKLLLTGKARQLLSIGKETEQVTGKPFVVILTVASEDYAAKNPEIVKSVVRAYKEAYNYIKGHPEVYQETGFAKLLGVKPTKEVNELLAKRFTPLYINRWDKEVVEGIDATYKIFKEYGILKKTRDDWYTFDFVP
jgi:ABC-type nitrate/sulfonate/bicarbonate transport system substrate-binding protein